VSSHADVMAAAETIGLPLVLKPRFGSGASGLRFITSSKELTRSSEFDSELSKRYFLGQQWVPGRGVGIGALVLNGQVLAVAGHLRLREIPISGGASTARVTFRHVEMEAAAARLLIASSLDGVALAEFRFDDTTGNFWLLEVNPRYWGGVSTAISSGVDLPKLHVGALLRRTYPDACVVPTKCV